MKEGQEAGLQPSKLHALLCPKKEENYRLLPRERRC